jgi:prepilin-type N-terminal cleavage/methylation domain-containing protein
VSQAGRGEGGYSLVEMMVVMVVLTTILTGITSAFIQGSRAELHLNNRFSAQLQANQSLDRLRRDVHCASSAAISGSTLTLSGCSSGDRSWCSVLVATSRYQVYRKSGSTCDSTGKLYADYLSSAATFSYTAPVANTSLAKVHVVFNVNVNPETTTDLFQLTDDLVLRNSLRG